MSIKELVKETLLVEAVGQFGVKANGEWVGVNEGVELSQFQRGQSYEVLTNRSKPTPKNPQGKKYISQIVGTPTSVVTSGSPLQGGTSFTASTKAGLVELTKPAVEKEAYWEKKNDSMLVGGLAHDSAQITASLVMVNGLTETAAIETFQRVLTAIIGIRKGLDA